jgi:hypothetical protein
LKLDSGDRGNDIEFSIGAEAAVNVSGAMDSVAKVIEGGDVGVRVRKMKGKVAYFALFTFLVLGLVIPEK